MSTSTVTTLRKQIEFQDRIEIWVITHVSETVILTKAIHYRTDLQNPEVSKKVFTDTEWTEFLKTLGPDQQKLLTETTASVASTLITN